MVRVSKKKQVVVELDAESVVVPVVVPVIEPVIEPITSLVAEPMLAPVDAVAALIAEPVTVPTESTAKSESKRPTITSINATLVQHSIQLESTIEKMLTENVVKMEERLSAHTAEVINLLHENNQSVATILAIEEKRMNNLIVMPLEPSTEQNDVDSPLGDSMADVAPIEESSFFSYYQPFVIGFITGALASMIRTSSVLKPPFFL